MRAARVATLCVVGLLAGCDSGALLAAAEDDEVPAVHVTATARQTAWRFAYPEIGIAFEARAPSEDDPIGIGAAAPVGRKVRLAMTSADAIYSVAIPALGVAADAIPGRISEVWFAAEAQGLYESACAEPCGEDGARLRFTVAVASEEDFQRWAGCAARLTLEASAGEASADSMAECAALIGAPAPPN